MDLTILLTTLITRSLFANDVVGTLHFFENSLNRTNKEVSDFKMGNISKCHEQQERVVVKADQGG